MFHALLFILVLVEAIQVDTIEKHDAGQSTLEYWQSFYAKVYPVQFWDENAKVAPEFLSGVFPPVSDVSSKRRLPKDNIIFPKDRNIHEKRITGTSCGVGRELSVNATRDLCLEAQNCTLAELNCDGTLYRNPQRPPDLAICDVTEVACKGSPAFGVELPGCMIQKFEDRNFALEKLYTSFVQVVCDGNKLWGFQSWNMKCETDKLWCEGKEVKKGMVRNDHTCRTASEVCNAASLNDPDSCQKVTKTCLSESEVPTSFCATTAFHPTVDCSTVCLPRKIICFGTEYDADTYSGSLGLCERVVDFKCGTDVVGMNGLCRITEITCADGPQVFSFQNSIPQGCTVSRVICTNATLAFPPTCTEHFFGCSGCTYSVDTVPCSDQCRQRTTETVCECPVDHIGADCEHLRKISCKAIPTNSTGTPCSALDRKKVGEKYACFNLVPGEEVIKIEFKLECSFDGYNYNKTAVDLDGFKYYFKDENIAVTRSLLEYEDWALSLTFLNYDSQVDSFTLHTSIHRPDETLLATVNSSTIPSKFWLDSRLRIEAVAVPGHANTPRPVASFIVLVGEGAAEEDRGRESTWLGRNRRGLISFAVVFGIALLLGCAVGGRDVVAMCRPKRKAYVRI